MVTNKQKRSSNGQRATGRGPAGAHTRRDARENGAVKGRLKGAEPEATGRRAPRRRRLAVQLCFMGHTFIF